MQKQQRREFMKTAGAAALLAGTTAVASAAQQEDEKINGKRINMNRNQKFPPLGPEFISGMRKQAEGVKIFVEQEGSPLKACLVGNPSSLYFANPETDPGVAAILKTNPDKWKEMAKLGQKNLWDVDPQLAEAMTKESDGLADAYRQAGAKVIRNETGKTPPEIVDYQLHYGGPKYCSVFTQESFETFGNVCVKINENHICDQADLVYRDAMIEIMRNDPDAVWLHMPRPYPSNKQSYFEPKLSSGDPKLLADKNIIIGIGVAEPSHIDDLSKPRSASDEFGVEMFRRMIEPFGFKVHTIYYDRNLTYHLDAFMSVVDESTVAFPKDHLWSPLPGFMKDYKIIDMAVEDQGIGCANSEVLNKGELLIPRGSTRFADDLRKHGVEPVEIAYENIYKVVGSGIHCSTSAIWREG